MTHLQMKKSSSTTKYCWIKMIPPPWGRFGFSKTLRFSKDCNLFAVLLNYIVFFGIHHRSKFESCWFKHPGRFYLRCPSGDMIILDNIPRFHDLILRNFSQEGGWKNNFELCYVVGDFGSTRGVEKIRKTLDSYLHTFVNRITY
jgi:hypothetical protein